MILKDNNLVLFFFFKIHYSKETLESVFITLLQTLGPLHIKPAFNT
jgi:hypothetical protein